MPISSLTNTPAPLPCTHVRGADDICRVDSKDLLFCDVRQAFMQWAKNRRRQQKRKEAAANATAPSLYSSGVSHSHPLPASSAPLSSPPSPVEVVIDVAKQPRVKMEEHAGFKYLLHLDGQSCSSR